MDMDNVPDITQLQQLVDTYVIPYGLKLLAAILIFIVGRWVATALANGVGALMRRNRVEETLVSFTRNLLHAALLVFVVVAAIGQLGIQTASFVAIVGAACLAIGLALQGSLSNFAAGVMMIIFKPFKAGDLIEAAGIAGVVEEIMIFSIRLRTGDNKVIVVPNGAVMGGNIINYSAMPTRRVYLSVVVGHGTDIAHIRQLLDTLIRTDSRVLADPAPVVGATELGVPGITLVVRPWVKSEDYWDVFFDLNERIQSALREAGVPAPSRP